MKGCASPVRAFDVGLKNDEKPFKNFKGWRGMI